MRAHGRRKSQLPPAPAKWHEEVVALEELGFDTPLARTLWRALRDLRVWSRDANQREHLGREPSASIAERTAFALTVAPELTASLGTFSLLGSKPGLCTARQLAEACSGVYEWAERRSLLLVAVHFGEAAASVDDDPRWALAAGKFCRSTGQYERAGRWYARAFGLARSARHTSDAVRALLGYGGLLRSLGRLDGALPYLERAARRAGRRNRRRLAAEAHHDLLLLLTETGEYDRARYHAEGAARYYSRRHERMPFLAHDAAFLLLRLRHYSHASVLTEGLPGLIPRPNDAALVWSTVAWAAAGAGRVDHFREAEREALQLVGLAREHAPAILLHLAEAARAIGEWDAAVRYAGASEAAASLRGDKALQREAWDLGVALAAGAPATPEREAGSDIKALVRALRARVPSRRR